MSDKGYQILIQEIESAFADVAYPGDDNLVKSLEYYDNLKVVIDFKGKHWKEISLKNLLKHRFDLPRFTPEAFRFYLPAFLISSLHGEAGGEIIGHVISSLSQPISERAEKEEFLNILKAFDSKQRAALKAFIRAYIESEKHLIPDDLRMAEFWENYE
jgi:hypothetical protein